MQRLKKYAGTILVLVIGIPLLIVLRYVFAQPACHVPFCSSEDVVAFLLFVPALTVAGFMNAAGVPGLAAGIALILILVGQFALVGFLIDLARQVRVTRRT